MNALLYLLYIFTWTLAVGVVIFAYAHLRKNRSRLEETKRVFGLRDVREYMRETRGLLDLFWWREEVPGESSQEGDGEYLQFFRGQFLPLAVQMIRQREVAGIASLVAVGMLLLTSVLMVFLGTSSLGLASKLVDMLPLIFLAVTLPFLVLRILKDYRRELLLLVLVEVKMEKMLEAREQPSAGSETEPTSD